MPSDLDPVVWTEEYIQNVCLGLLAIVAIWIILATCVKWFVVSLIGRSNYNTLLVIMILVSTGTAAKIKATTISTDMSVVGLFTGRTTTAIDPETFFWTWCWSAVSLIFSVWCFRVLA